MLGPLFVLNMPFLYVNDYESDESCILVRENKIVDGLAVSSFW